MPTTTTSANVPTTKLPTHLTFHKRFAQPPPPAKQIHPPNNTNAPTTAATTVPRNVTAPSVSPARQQPSSPPLYAKPPTCPYTNETQQSNVRAPHPSITPPYVVSIRRPHHPSYFDQLPISLHYPSPIDDSGNDSTFSTASSPGHPPFSHGNSDIDDQFERYIRDQRVAAIVTTPNENTSPLSTYPPNDPVTNRPQPNPYHLHTQRAIAEHHRAMANDSDSDTDLPRPLSQTVTRMITTQRMWTSSHLSSSSSVDTTTQWRPSKTIIHPTPYLRHTSPPLVQKGIPAPHSHPRSPLPPANDIAQPLQPATATQRYSRNTKPHEPPTHTAAMYVCMYVCMYVYLKL